MKRTIGKTLFVVTTFSVVISLICTTLIYYEIFKKQVISDLKTEAEIISNYNADSLKRIEDLRITVISSNGSVIFDNDVDAENMTNHLDRPEVKEAFLSNEGFSIRKSDTMGMKTIYFALLMDNGNVLRLSKDVKGINSLYASSFPIVFIVLIIIEMLCVLISGVLVQKLIKPIEKISDNLDEASKEDVYEELLPFVEHISKQHSEIIKASRSRQDFTANVSHELKTPLTAISGYAELIENDLVSDEEKDRFIKEIHNNSNRLELLIDDIIKLSQLDQDKYEGEFEDIDISELVKSRLDIYKMNATKKNICISFEEEETIVKTDKYLFINLIDNLVSNAIRYNKENGHVRIVVKNYSLTVEDDGIGIPDGDKERVFERFYRVDKSRSRSTGGTGLGLSIVKHIVELHKWNIVLESKENIGTKIVIHF